MLVIAAITNPNHKEFSAVAATNNASAAKVARIKTIEKLRCVEINLRSRSSSVRTLDFSSARVAILTKLVVSYI